MSRLPRLFSSAVRALCLAAALLTSAGCSTKAPEAGHAIKLSSVRPRPDDIKVIPVMLPRESLKEAIQEDPKLNTFRLVEVFAGQGDSNTQLMQYRIFGIRPNSAPDLLGLKDSDILVAANDYVIRNPRTFGQYLSLLQNEREAEIEIVRNGKPMLLKYSFHEKPGTRRAPSDEADPEPMGRRGQGGDREPLRIPGL